MVFTLLALLAKYSSCIRKKIIFNKYILQFSNQMPLLAEYITILVSHPKDPNMLKDLNYFIQKRKNLSL